MEIIFYKCVYSDQQEKLSRLPELKNSPHSFYEAGADHMSFFSLSRDPLSVTLATVAIPKRSQGKLPEHLTTREVARYLRLNEKKVYALIAARKLPGTRVSGKWLFPKALIDGWLKERTI